jgi:two-component system, NtrC family, sensor kinase
LDKEGMNIRSTVGLDKEGEKEENFTQSLAVLGKLAAGIAHEINTPAQYVSDNILFLQDAFDGLRKVFDQYRLLYQSVKAGVVKAKTVQTLEELIVSSEVDYYFGQIPGAIRQSIEGMNRIIQILGAMRDFSHPGLMEKKAIDINRAIQNTILVTRNIWKNVADVETAYDETLPPVPCQAGEINQVLLNLIVNAADAIAEVKEKPLGELGRINIRTIREGETVEIRISDTGAGIPERIQKKIFDPFFTTKPVGKGTGQGLTLSAAVIANHKGTIHFETGKGTGTTFIIRLPLLGQIE